MNKKRVLYFLSFIIPISILLISYYSIGIFTEYSILTNDLESQYSMFLSYYRNNIMSNGVFYSFSKGLGGNFFGILTYYLMSPLNLITFLFKPENLEYAIALIMLIKSGLTGISFFHFISLQDNKTDIISLTFSLFYSLSSCFIVWHYHVLWTDAFYLLPIIILGVQNIFKNKSSKLFIFSYVACVIINFYMAYMIGIFVFLFFIYDCIINNDKKTIINNFFRLGQSTIIVLITTLWVLIPTMFSLQQGKTIISGVEVGKRVFNIFALTPKIFIAGYDGVGTVTAPFIYSGISVFILTIAFFFIKSISLKEKIASFLMISFLFLSLIYKPLYLMFHLFSAPNGFPYRFVYLLSFFLVFLSYKSYRNIKDIDLKKYSVFLGLIGLIVISFIKIYPYPISLKNIIITLILALLTIILIFTSKKTIRFLPLIILISLFDLSYNTQGLLYQNYNALEFNEINSLKSSYIEIEKELSEINEDTFFRIANYNYDEINNSFKHGYSNFYDSFTSLPEVNHEKIKTNLFSTNNNLNNAFFCVKYDISSNEISDSKSIFPLLFTANKSVLSNDNSNLEKLISNIYSIPEINSITDADLEKIINLSHQNINYIKQSGNKINASIYSENDDTYVLSSIIFDEAWNVKVNGKNVNTTKVSESLLAFPIREGDNEIVLTYIPKGFIFSISVSVIGIVIFIFLNHKKFKLYTPY